MAKNNFWFISLCAFLIISVNLGLSVPLQIAIISNALIILIDVFKEIRRLHNERHKAEN